MADSEQAILESELKQIRKELKKLGVKPDDKGTAEEIERLEIEKDKLTKKGVKLREAFEKKWGEGDGHRY